MPALYAPAALLQHCQGEGGLRPRRSAVEVVAVGIDAVPDKELAQLELAERAGRGTLAAAAQRFPGAAAATG
jgi:hypothetical protein